MFTTLGKIVLTLLFLASVLGAGVAFRLFSAESGSSSVSTTPNRSTEEPLTQNFTELVTDTLIFDAIPGNADTPRPTPTPLPCDSSTRYSPLPDAQVLTYYGNPYTPQMGILGELTIGNLVERLRSHASVYDSLNGAKAVQPALHIVYATAQPLPGDSGLYLLYVDHTTLQRYIDEACRNGFLVILDLQIGRSNVEAEVKKILKYLQYPHVHLALDPEFAMMDGEVPGEAIGSLDAVDVNAAQGLLQSLVEEHDLPKKMLIVHQFLEDMITNPGLIEDYPAVELVVDMDGFGAAADKIAKYHIFTPKADHPGIKLFFQQDVGLMTERQVLELLPGVIIYQ